MIKAYDYQEEGVKALDSSFGLRRQALLVAPPGTGKTITAALWSRRHLGRGRGLFLCHENRILEQAMREFRQVLGDEPSLGVFHGERKVFDPVDILFASFQTLRTWKDALLPDDFLFVIVDEGHHASARTFRQVIEHFTPRYLLGMTGTPDRMDDQDIRDIFGPEVVNISLEAAIANNWLAPFEYRVITDNFRPAALHRLIREELGEDRRVSFRQLNETIFVKLRDEQVAQRIMELGRKTIIFCERTEHADHFCQFLPNSAAYHSHRSQRQNRQALEAFRRGDIQYILAVNKLNEGIDIPDAEVIVFYRCTDSEIIFLQQLGRGARKSPGKEKYIVLDFVSNLRRLIAVQEMAEKVLQAQRERGNIPLTQEPIHLSGNGFNFRFTEEQLEILDVVSRLRPKLVSEVPELAKEYASRNELPADQVFVGTARKLWWTCSKCEHEWQATGNSRNSSRAGCPACARRVASLANNLAITHPELAREYSSRNELPVDQVLSGTSKKLWWKCFVCEHEWQETGGKRVGGRRCPACFGHAITPANSLKGTHPELAQEYSPRNELPADQVVAGTGRKLWWKCSVCKHEWQATGHDRVLGTRCPSCSRRVATSTNNLTMTHPELAREYSPRNELPADQVLAGTPKKLWWVCSACGHEWQTSAVTRTTGSGCPACAGHVPTPTNNLTVTHPELAREYLSRNELSADHVLAGTKKKLWWVCSACGHEWQAQGWSRVHGTGCPECTRRKRQCG